jgi:hypothetical protein
LLAAPERLGELVVLAGPSGERNPGIMRMRAGQAEVDPFRWPKSDDAAVAYLPGRWLAGSHHPRARELSVWRSGDAEAQLIGKGEELRVVAARCGDKSCGLLVERLGDHAGSLLFQGGATEEPERWRRIELTRADDGPLRPFDLVQIEQDPASPSPSAVVVLGDDRRQRFFRVSSAEPQPVAHIDTPFGAVAAAMAGEHPAVLSRAGVPNDCSAEAGGAVVAIAADRVRLRALAPAVHGALRPIDGGLVALWQAPKSCGAAQGVLHGSVIARGRSLGPVSVIADADEFAVAAKGDRVDLWLVDDGVVTFVSLRCTVPLK